MEGTGNRVKISKIVDSKQFLSLLIAKGLNVVNVAALAGDTVEVISKIYAHSFAEKRAAAMDMIGAAFEQALPVKAAPPMFRT